MTFWEVDILGVGILGVGILGVGILGVDILGVDILRLTQRNKVRKSSDQTEDTLQKQRYEVHTKIVMISLFTLSIPKMV